MTSRLNLPSYGNPLQIFQGIQQPTDLHSLPTRCAAFLQFGSGKTGFSNQQMKKHYKKLLQDQLFQLRWISHMTIVSSEIILLAKAWDCMVSKAADTRNQAATTGMKLYNNIISTGTVALLQRNNKHHFLMQFYNPIITTRRHKIKARDPNAFCLESTNQTEYKSPKRTERGSK